MICMKRIQAQKPGASIVYHIGNLGRDRVDPNVARLADLYRRASCLGLGILTQRRIQTPYMTIRGRHVDGAFAYVFTRSGAGV